MPPTCTRRSRRRRDQFEGSDLRLHAHGASVRDARRQPDVLSRRLAAVSVRQTGKFVKELGQDVYGFNAAIGLRVDPQDNVWTSTAAEPGREVRSRRARRARARAKAREHRRAAGGRGRPGRAGRRRCGRSARPRPAAAAAARGGGRGGGGGGAAALPARAFHGDSFNRPADVAWDRAGNIYIADGIGNNNRIAKFDKDGNFIKQWGSTGPAHGQFTGAAWPSTRPATSTSPTPATSAFRCSTATALSSRSSATSARRWRMCIAGARRSTSTSRTRAIPTAWRTAPSTRSQLDGKVVGKFGTAGKLPKQFGLANSIDCRNENELLVGEDVELARAEGHAAEIRRRGSQEIRRSGGFFLEKQVS